MISDIVKRIAENKTLTENESAELMGWFARMENAPYMMENLYPSGGTVINKMSQISQDLGDITRGNFVSGDNGDPTDESGNNPFTGVAMMSPGLSVDSGADEAAIWGKNVGNLTFWISSQTGAILAGGGAVRINEDGIQSYNAGDAIEFYEPSNTTYSFISMISKGDGSLTPLNLFSFAPASETNLLTNGDFETGDLTSWTETDPDGIVSVISGGYKNTYSLQFDMNAGMPSGTTKIEQTITAATGAVVSFRARTTVNLVAFNIYSGVTPGGAWTIRTDGEWKRYVFVVPAAYTSFYIQPQSISVASGGPGSDYGELQIDDLVVRALGANGLYSAGLKIAPNYISVNGEFGVGSPADTTSGYRFHVDEDHAQFQKPISFYGSPSISLSSNQNDYKPSGINTYNVLRINCTSASNITGINPKNSADSVFMSRILGIENIGTQNITLKNDDSASAANYRFSFLGDIVIPPLGTVFLWYDTVTVKWKIFGQSTKEAWPVGSVFTSVVSTNPNTLLGYGTWSAFGAGRVLVGLDSGQTEFDTVEETGGANTHTLVTGEMPAHGHTQDSHNHTQDAHTHTQNSHNHTQDAHTHTQNSHNHTQDTHGHTVGLEHNNNTTVTGAGIRVNDIDNQTGASGTAATANTSNTVATNQAATATNQNATATNQAATATNQNATATNQATTATNQNTGGGGAHNNLQPYIVVYFWKRTA